MGTQRCGSSDSRTVKAPAKNEIGSLLRDHDGWCICVAGYHNRHD
jgi:hypothetical protein